jgi:hypothetical protein
MELYKTSQNMEKEREWLKLELGYLWEKESMPSLAGPSFKSSNVLFLYLVVHCNIHLNMFLYTYMFYTCLYVFHKF